MSKLHFLIKHGTLDQAKKAVTTSDKNVLGHATAMVKLLDRMKDEGDPDYEKVRNEHMDDFASNRIKSLWIVDSQHVGQEHLKTMAKKFPNMIDRVAKNKIADDSTLRHVYDIAKNTPPHIDSSYDARKNIAQHPNASRELVQHIADNDRGMAVRAFAQERLKSLQ